jgi:ankyrin repeat protein
MDIITLLLDAGVPIDYKADDQISSAVFVAAQHNRFEVVRELIDRGCAYDDVAPVRLYFVTIT